MNKQHEDLQELLELTEAILAKAKTIGSKMDDNQTEDLVEVQILFDRRQEVIDRLEALKNGAEFEWSAEGKEMVKSLQDAELELNPLMNSLHQAFTNQMNRINQTKQMSKKYRGAYQSTPADGTFLDIRK